MQGSYMRKNKEESVVKNNSMNDQTEMEEGKFLLTRKCEGAVCEVTSLRNELLMVGTVEMYNAKMKEIRIDIQRQRAAAEESEMDPAVKIVIHDKQEEDEVLLFYGTAYQRSDEFWCIKLDEIEEHREARENFRMPVKSAARVKADGAGSEMCSVEDISITGICFLSRKPYAVNEKLSLSELILVDNGTCYTLPVEIVRRQETVTESGEECFRYGCRFLDITEKDQNEICRDIFTLQSTGFRRK